MKKIWQKWKFLAEKIGNLAEKIGNFQFKIIFSVLFYLIVIPVGLIMKLLLNPSKKNSKSWQDLEDNTSSLDKIRRQ